MPFGEIFTGAFQQIWRHKKLWLFAMLGLALSGVATLLYSLFAFQWMGGYASFISGIMRNPNVFPGTAFSNFLGSMSWLWAAGALAGLFGLVGYIVNLAARGAIANEANHAWRGEATDTRRGWHRGLHRAVYVFLIDLLWWLPAIALVVAGGILFFLLIAGSAAASDGNRAGGLIATSWIAFCCCGGCLGLLYYLAFAIFSPLMYQSAVAGERDLSAAIREGWSLARTHLGAMVIFWLLLLLVGIVLGVIEQTISTLVGLPLFSGWFQAMGDMMQGFSRGTVPALPALNGPLLVLMGLVAAVVSFLVSSLMQTLNLTVYAGVYQRVAGVPPAGPVGPAPIQPLNPAEATPVTTVRPDAPMVPPPVPQEPEVPPTL